MKNLNKYCLKHSYTIMYLLRNMCWIFIYRRCITCILTHYISILQLSFTMWHISPLQTISDKLLKMTLVDFIISWLIHNCYFIDMFTSDSAWVHCWKSDGLSQLPVDKMWVTEYGSENPNFSQQNIVLSVSNLKISE